MTNSQLTPIKFGTDGWRAIISDGYTYANLARVAQAYADYLKQADPNSTAKPLTIIGYDNRFMSEQFAARAAEILAGNDFAVALFSAAMPTPVISWAVREKQAVGGIVITASHNPATFNGFKIKAPFGGSAPPAITLQVEKLIDVNAPRRAEFDTAQQQNLLADAIKSYRQQITNYIDLESLKKMDTRIVIDSMHGTGGDWTERFLTGGALQTETLRGARDPLFGGGAPEPIDRNLAPLKERVKASGALLGLATDGDADRVGAVNELGATMTMHEVVPLLVLHLARQRKMTGGVVRTFSQSVLTKRIADAFGLKSYETAIGFKYIADLMLQDDILIGAEESGGIGVKGHIPERDGILNSLLLLEAVALSDKTPSEMVKAMHREFGAFYFDRRDLHKEVATGQEFVARMAENPPDNFGAHRVKSVATLDGTKFLFADESWLLFRQSGTEPVLRIYAEAASTTKVAELLAEGVKSAQIEN